jgi:hypothetical protein
MFAGRSLTYTELRFYTLTFYGQNRFYGPNRTVAQAVAEEIDTAIKKATARWLEQHGANPEAPGSREWIEETGRRLSTWLVHCWDDDVAADDAQ